MPVNSVLRFESHEMMNHLSLKEVVRTLNCAPIQSSALISVNYGTVNLVSWIGRKHAVRQDPFDESKNKK